MLPRRRCPFCRRWFHPHPRLKERQKTFRYRLFFRPDFLPSFLLSFNRAFLFYFFSLLPAHVRIVSPQAVRWRRNVCSQEGGVLCRRWFHPHPRLKERQKTFRYRLFFRPDFLPSFLLSFNRAFLFYFFSLLPAHVRIVSPQAVRWRRNVCSQEGGVLSVVAGFIPIRGSRSGRRPLDIACSSALIFFLPSCSVSIGLFSFTFSLFFRRHVRIVSPQAVRWRRNVCSQEGGVLSVVAGFVPIRGSRSGKRPVVDPNAAGSRSAGSIRNGGTSTPITFAVPMHFKEKSTERVPRKSVATASSIPTTYGATQFSFEIGASNGDKRL